MIRSLAARSDALLRLAATLLLLGLLACVILGVIFRQAKAPLAWTDEMAQYLLVWTGFVGWVIAARRRTHIRIETIVERLPPAVRRWLEMVIHVAVAGFGLAISWHGVALIWRNWDIEAVSVPISASVLYMGLPLAGLGIALQSAADLAAVFSGRTIQHKSAGEAIT